MAIQVNNINILEAHKRIANLIIKTPCVYEPFLSEQLQAQIYLKLENRQRTGSFKERGAVNRLLLMTQAEKRLGVVTASAGNHAQAVAYHASQQGIKSTIFMPLCAPEIKVTHTQKFGAEVHLLGEDYDEAQQAALQFAQESGAFYLHAYDDPWVIAGQGTVGLEILEQIPSVDLILCPVGGGGLISGISVALENHPIQIIGIQSKTVPSMKQALESGGPVTLPIAQTIADGIRVRRVGKLTYEICQKLVSRWVLVEESVIAHAQLYLLEQSKIVSEAAGAISLAALLENQISNIQGKTVCVVVSGGNIDVKLEIMESGQRARSVLTLRGVLG